jgi:hypothetical protein
MSRPLALLALMVAVVLFSALLIWLSRDRVPECDERSPLHYGRCVL